MRVACYCRVSTNKDEQLDSLENQVEFFSDLCREKGYELYRIYADEGISGRSTLKRKEFLRMMEDARAGKFSAILVKDVSRLARNTVDFLVTIRELKSLGVNVFFVTYGMDIKDCDETYLTMLAALAQDESARLSARVKMGKNVSARKGRVPNFVFGYDRADKYTLVPNPAEAKIVREIFDMYVNRGMGVLRIAQELNRRGIKTKKDRHQWSGVVVKQILQNQLYIGRVINKKQEVADFLTGKRRDMPEDEQVIVERPEFAIIGEDTFRQAQEILKQRCDEFKMNNKRPSYRHPLSQLLKCSECGYSFRRCVRQYTQGGKRIRYWICSYRNAYGAGMCSNQARIDEEDMHALIVRYLKHAMQRRQQVIDDIARQVQAAVQMQNDGMPAGEIKAEIQKIIKKKEKYMEMYAMEVIDAAELKKYTDRIDADRKKLRMALQAAQDREASLQDIRRRIDALFGRIDDVLRNSLDNAILKQIFDKLVVYPDKTIRAYLAADPAMTAMTGLVTEFDSEDEPDSDAVPKCKYHP